MRILMVTEDIPAEQVGGLGKHVVTLANAMIEAGHDVHLMGRSERDYSAHAEEVGFSGKFIPGFDFSRTGWKESQFGVFVSPKRPALANRIAKAVNAIAANYDVVHYHGHLPMVGNYLLPGINFVQTRHDQGAECLIHTRFKNGGICDDLDPGACAACVHPTPGALRTYVSASAVRRYRDETAQCFSTHKTIFVSDFLRRQFLRAMPASRLDKAVVIHNFIDLERLRRVTQSPASHPASMLLVGRIDAAKGFAEFLGAAAAKIPSDMAIDIIGDGPDRASLEKKYAGSQLRFLGWRPYDEVVSRTLAARACVIPSVWQEPCGTTILEALAMGRPCAALSRGGTPELVCYQRFEGQLRLASDMESLVTAAIAQYASGNREDTLPLQHNADVSAKMSEILEIYAS